MIITTWSAKNSGLCLSGSKINGPDADGKICVDIQPVMDKAWAERAGLGWIGKHTKPDHPRVRLMGFSR
jgi:hypothetical protein